MPQSSNDNPSLHEVKRGFLFGLGMLGASIVVLAFALICVGLGVFWFTSVRSFSEAGSRDFQLQALDEMLDNAALVIAADAGLDVQALAADREALAQWRKEITRRAVAAKPFQQPWYPTERERQRKLDVPGLVLGDKYAVPNWFMILDAMCEDPDGVKDKKYSQSNEPFTYLGIEEFKGLVFFKVRASHTNLDLFPLGYLEGYVPASEFAYQRPHRISNS